jgi:oligopeptide transport system substrate-binding protein
VLAGRANRTILRAPRSLVVALGVLGLTVGLGLGAAACSDDAGDDAAEVDGPATEGVLRLAVFDLSTLDPAEVVPTEQVEMIAADLLFDSLTVLPDGVTNGDEVVVEPALAESLTPDDDHVVWTATLAGRSFSDGSSITADDVRFSLERVVAQGPDSLAGARLELVEGYEAFVAGESSELTGLRVVDESTIEITLREAFVELPVLLASPLYGIVPAGADESHDFWVAPVGSGSFRFAEREGSTLRLERVAAGDSGEPIDDGVPGDGTVRVVELVEFETREDAYEAFVEGAVDWALVPSSALREATNEFTGDEFEFLGAELWLGFDLREPMFDDVRLRWAIVRAVDSDEVVGEALPGRWTMRGMVPRGVPGRAADPCHGLCEHDPDEARRLLADAYPDGDVPTVTLHGYDEPEQRRMLEVVQGQLDSVGIPAEVEVRPLEEYRSFVADGDGGRGVFSFWWVGLVPLEDSYLAPPFETGAADNVVGLADDRVDELIARARSTVDAGERRGLYQELEQALLEQAVIVPIAQSRTNQVVGGRVSGWQTRLDGTIVLDPVRLASG